MRAGYWVLCSILNKSDIDIEQLVRAKRLFYLGTLSVWGTSAVLFFFERNLRSNASQFAPTFLFVVGITLLVITVISSVFAVMSAQSKHGRDKANAKKSAMEFKRLVNASFSLTTLIWISSWFLS